MTTGVIDKSGNNPFPIADGARMSRAPAVRTSAITPSDSTDLSVPARALYIGSSGDVSLEDIKGNTRQFNGLLAGTTLSVQVKRVNSTNTSASDIVGMY